LPGILALMVHLRSLSTPMLMPTNKSNMAKNVPSAGNWIAGDAVQSII